MTPNHSLSVGTQVARFAFEGGTITSLKIKSRVLSLLSVAVYFFCALSISNKKYPSKSHIKRVEKLLLAHTPWFLEKLLLSRAGLKTVGTAAFRLLRCIARELVDDGVASGVNHLKPR